MRIYCTTSNHMLCFFLSYGPRNQERTFELNSRTYNLIWDSGRKKGIIVFFLLNKNVWPYQFNAFWNDCEYYFLFWKVYVKIRKHLSMSSLYGKLNRDRALNILALKLRGSKFSLFPSSSSIFPLPWK